MLNVKSITQRLTKSDDLLLKLQKLQGYSWEEYKANELVQGSCERYMQVAIECCTDIASHLLAAYGLKRPAHRRDVFRVLVEAGYLERDYAERMVQMVRLRNRLVHLYWDIDPAKMTTTCKTTCRCCRGSGPSLWQSWRRQSKNRKKARQRQKDSQSRFDLARRSWSP